PEQMDRQEYAITQFKPRADFAQPNSETKMQIRSSRCAEC
ncbi:MAG: hypothetical protein ACI9G1_004178, partial [Pirellulaceae bacterium]